MCHQCFRVIFSRKNSERSMSIFQQNSGKGYNVWKKFQIGSVTCILMTEMTNQRKTELIVDFELVWTKNPQILENGSDLSQNSPQILFWRPPLGTKIPKSVPLFFQKFQKGSM